MSMYACSDLHGMKELYLKIKDFLKPEDKVFFLGDAGDRGPQPWELIKLIFEDEQFIYIKGNHEQLLENAITEYEVEGIPGDNLYLLVDNGGRETFRGWMHESEEVQIGYYNALRNLPDYMIYENKNGIEVVLTHAGFTPITNKIEIPDKHTCMWDRTHLNDKWTEDLPKNVVIVHGHTPISINIEDFTPKAYWYCDNHKVDLDNAAFATGATVLLDLDTFEEHVFKIETV